MKRSFTIIFITLCFFSCQNNQSATTEKQETRSEFIEIIEQEYELYKPNQKASAVLILFGGYPESIEDIKREFKILDVAERNNVVVLVMNYNQRIWLEEEEKHSLAKKLQDIIVQNELPTNNIYIGGFSSGGIVSLLISDFIMGVKQFHITPKGVFIVDSPVDLAELYEGAKKNIANNFSEVSVQESTWIIQTLDSQFGNPKADISIYEKHSVYTLSTNNIDNVRELKNTKIRLYTEPDTTWWKKYKMANYQQMNAFHIKKLSEDLKKNEFEYVEYIPTTNRGYRANGERHPHSWSIVDKNDLMNWILEKQNDK